MSFEQRFPVGSTFYHCERKCVVMRYMDAGEAFHTCTVIGLKYAYADAVGLIHHDVIAEREYPAIEAQNLASKMEMWPAPRISCSRCVRADGCEVGRCERRGSMNEVP